jgi:hypothetical protein
VFGEEQEGNTMDDEQGRSLISFPYPAGTAEGTDPGIIINKMRRAIELVRRPRKGRLDERTPCIQDYHIIITHYFFS